MDPERMGGARLRRGPMWLDERRTNSEPKHAHRSVCTHYARHSGTPRWQQDVRDAAREDMSPMISSRSYLEQASNVQPKMSILREWELRKDACMQPRR